MSYFSEEELKLIEALTYNPELEPRYDIMKDSLIWDDEIPDKFNGDSYEKVGDLLIARSFIHRKVPFSSWRLAPTYFAEVWSNATTQGFKWPGFFRLELSDKDRKYYEQQRTDLMNGDYL